MKTKHDRQHVLAYGLIGALFVLLAVLIIRILLHLPPSPKDVPSAPVPLTDAQKISILNDLASTTASSTDAAKAYLKENKIKVDPKLDPRIQVLNNLAKPVKGATTTSTLTDAQKLEKLNSLMNP